VTEYLIKQHSMQVLLIVLTSHERSVLQELHKPPDWARIATSSFYSTAEPVLHSRATAMATAHAVNAGPAPREMSIQSIPASNPLKKCKANGAVHSSPPLTPTACSASTCSRVPYAFRDTKRSLGCSSRNMGGPPALINSFFPAAPPLAVRSVGVAAEVKDGDAAAQIPLPRGGCKRLSYPFCCALDHCGRKGGVLRLTYASYAYITDS
jgi:hypothetical protein